MRLLSLVVLTGLTLTGCTASMSPASTDALAITTSRSSQTLSSRRSAARSSVRSSSSASSITQAALEATSASSSLAPLPARAVPVLVYHHLRPTGGYATETWSYKMSVSPAVFERQMQWLADEGFTTVSLDEAVAVLAGASSIEKPVVITFDDNQRSALDVALPIFAKHGQTATFYLITNRLENTSMIGSADIPTLVEAGMDVQSHTVSHPALTTLAASALATELRASREALEALTGKPVRHVAYPLTAHNQTVRDATAAAGYVTGSIMDPRVAQPGVDLFKLPRIMVTDETDLASILD